MEKTWPLREEMDKIVFIFRQSRHISLYSYYNQYFFLFVLDLACKQFFSHQGKGKNRRNERTILNIIVVFVWIDILIAQLTVTD